MKKKTLLMTSMLLAALLAGCSSKQTEPTSSSSDTSKTSQTSTTSSDSSTTDSSSATTTAGSQEPVATIPLVTMDIEAISQGDYSSIIGTWQNAEGRTLTFNSLGLTTDGLTLGQHGSFEEGMYMVGVSTTEGASSFALSMVPKGIVIAPRYFLEGETDLSDSNQDRMFGAQAVTSAEAVKNQTYYRVISPAANTGNPLSNQDTGVSLESGQVTIDYANAVLGDRSWSAIESNYNRTESIPFELLQGNDGSLYRVYRNGVITSETKNVIVYLP